MMDIPAATAYAFGLLLFRSAGLCMTAPLLSSKTVPARIRLSVAVVIAFSSFSGAGFPAAVLPSTFLTLAQAIALETFLGIAAGTAAKVVLDAAQMAGQVAGLSMGFGYGAMIDPVNGVESTAIGELFHLIALGVAVGLGIHREAIMWLAVSATNIPPGATNGLTDFLQHSVMQAIYAVTLAVRLAFPLIAAVTFGHATLGVINKAAPQISLSNVGFSIAIVAGGGAIYVMLPTIAHIAAQEAVSMFVRH